MTYRLTVSYLGTAYAGWQFQNNALSVQQVLEQALLTQLATHGIDARPRTIGSGRTDAGVHARAQVVHFRLPDATPPLPLPALVHGLDHHLPADIRVLAAARMPSDFHAQRSAISKEYRYRLAQRRLLSPLEAFTTVSATGFTAGRDLDLDVLRRVSAILPGRHDFTAFARIGGNHDCPVRRLDSAEWHQDSDDPALLELRIRGQGFLRGMVRGLVGTLLQVASGERTPEAFAQLLTGRPRREAGPNAPAHGLVLYEVSYPASCTPLEVYDPDAWGPTQEECDGVIPSGSSV